MIPLKIIMLTILALDQLFFWSSFARESKLYASDDFMRSLLGVSIWANALLVTFVCYLVFIL